MKLKALEILIDLRDNFIYGELHGSIHEAINELEELEIKASCATCKHYKQSSHHIYKTCFLIKTNGFNLESNIDFCCNKWQSKK